MNSRFPDRESQYSDLMHPVCFNMLKSVPVIALWILLYLLLAPTVSRADLSPARVLTEIERSQVQSHVYSDGEGLPEGQGDAVNGKGLYASLCASCHGSQGQGGSALELVGDRSLLNTEYPDRGIAVYWPYAPTLFEYVRRSMPPGKPYSLDDAQTYSVVAYLLKLNGLATDVDIVDKDFLSKLEMPNKNGFIDTTN